MNQPNTRDYSPARAVISNKRHLSVVWILPLLALIIGGWMVAQTYLNRGPEISIYFDTAEGLEPGNTRIKNLNVDVGTVLSVALTPELDRVLVKARILPVAAPLLREDTQFWIVRPRVGSSGISGLGTLLSGVYIELSPGKTKTDAREFDGLTDMPVTPKNVPGLHLVLVSEEGSSVNTGDPILYRGYKVGRVETCDFSIETRQVRSDIFIDAPYASLINGNTRFWNASGISFQADSSGVSLNTASLETLLIGGVAFDLPEGVPAGDLVKSGTQFILYPSHGAIGKQTYTHFSNYLLLFDSSVRGLSPGASVEYRGVRIGSVDGISFDYLPPGYGADEAGAETPIPVLIRVSPGYLSGRDTREDLDFLVGQINDGIANGLRGSLKTGNFLTGNLFVSLDFSDNALTGKVNRIGEYDQIPTVSGALDLFQTRASDLLEKFNDLPVEKIIARLGKLLDKTAAAVDSISKTAQTAQTFIRHVDTQNVPAVLTDTLADLRIQLKDLAAGYSADSPMYRELQQAVGHFRQTLKGLDDLVAAISTRPSSLVFSDPKQPDAIPEAPTR